MMKITKDIELQIFDVPIGVCVSGGADSALLLYFLLSQSKHTVHIFTFAAEDKFLKNPMTSIAVVSKCAELTNNYNFQHHFLYGKSQNKENLFELPRKYLQDGIVKFIYSGVTKNPPKQVTDTFREETTENEERDPTVFRSTTIGNWHRPWTNLDKQDIFSIYKLHNLEQTLLPVTRSCEWENVEKNGEDPGLGHCGTCWWCQERSWGMKVLDEK